MTIEKIKILFECDDFIAVDKPAGISVHNNEDSENLLSLLTKQLKRELSPVHRIDKETSGVQILATNKSSAQFTAKEFENRSVVKVYVGVLRGQLKDEQGAWNKPLTDKSEGRNNPEGILKGRVPCDTRFHRLNTSKYFSYCEFNLITGRQHQIRKHAAVANHALVGDPRYGEPSYNKKIADLYKQERMFLHCARIELLGQKIESPVPSSFEQLLIEN